MFQFVANVKFPAKFSWFIETQDEASENNKFSSGLSELELSEILGDIIFPPYVNVYVRSLFLSLYNTTTHKIRRRAKLFFIIHTGLLDALAKGLLSDPHVTSARVLTTNFSSGILSGSVWWRKQGLGVPIRVEEDGILVGAKPDQKYPW